MSAGRTWTAGRCACPFPAAGVLAAPDVRQFRIGPQGIVLVDAPAVQPLPG